MTTKNIYKMFNEVTRKFEVIDLDEAELLPGQKVLKFFWCHSDQRFVTVPGASLFVIDNDLHLVPSND